MKKHFLSLIILFFASSTQAQKPAQTASVEQSLYGFQAGVFGFWFHNETKLSKSIALRSEIGLDYGFFGGILYEDDTNYFLTPVLTLEPRWYYNLEKRLSKGRLVKNNSGNFVGLRMSFYPDLFVISNTENITVQNQIFIIPKWAIKRTLWDHFTYEAGIGLGWHHIFREDVRGFEIEDENEVALDLHIRIGYTF